MQAELLVSGKARRGKEAAPGRDNKGRDNIGNQFTH